MMSRRTGQCDIEADAGGVGVTFAGPLIAQPKKNTAHGGRCVLQQTQRYDRTETGAPTPIGDAAANHAPTLKKRATGKGG